jgi:hypothetical protein
VSLSLVMNAGAQLTSDVYLCVIVLRPVEGFEFYVM